MIRCAFKGCVSLKLQNDLLRVAVVRLRPKRTYCNRNLLSLEDRGLVSGVFPGSRSEFVNLCNGKPQTVYAGFDPTADSLHLGNLAVLVMLLHCQRAGHRVIGLLGGATAMIGDPSGRNTERPVLDKSSIFENCRKISDNILTVFANHEKYFWDDKGGREKLASLKIVNNNSWYDSMSVIDLIGKYGRHFRLTQMLSRESVKSRLDSGEGLSFTEFSYQIFQSYDWFYLHNNYQCNIQVGGHDQMGNIWTGHEFISRALNRRVYGLTVPIMKSESGSKYGKSAGNAIWLDAKKTSALDFYQFAVRATDAEVEQLLKTFSFRALPEIESILAKHKENPENRRAQKIFAEDLTKLVHGDSGLQSALRASEALYSGKIESLAGLSQSEMLEIFESPGAAVGVADIILQPGMTILQMAIKAGCFKTDRDARRIIPAGGFSLNHQKVQNIDEVIVPGIHILANKLSLVRVGKKNYYLIRWTT